MSRDVEVPVHDKADQHVHHSAVTASGAAASSHIATEDNGLQLLPMEDLVPLSQTLISPTLARLLNLNTPPTPNTQPALPQRHDVARAYEPFHSHYEELQQMQQLQEDDSIRDGAEEDHSPLKPNVEHPNRMHHQIMQMGGSFLQDQVKGDPASAGFKRSYANAGLSDHSYGMPLSDMDAPDDQGEGFGMNQLADRENSSNSGDGGAASGGGGATSSGARTLKRPRLVWTPQLHKRFVDAVSHLGIKNAVPKTIMQLMNVEGLTRENVASHLQKYRLYLRRVQQGSLFSSSGNSPTKSILGGFDHPHHHALIGAGPNMSPVAAAAGNNTDHLFSEIPSTNMASTIHHQQQISTHSLHRLPGPMNHHLLPQHMSSLLLQPVPQHQLNQSMAVAKSSPTFNLSQHLDPRRYTASTLSSSPVKKMAWPSPHASLMDMNVVHHMDNHGTPVAGSSSPRRAALTLFPH